MTEGPFGVVFVTDTTVVERIRDIQERLSRDRVVEAPLTVDLLSRKVVQNEDEEDQTESAAMDTRTNENNIPNDE